MSNLSKTYEILGDGDTIIRNFEPYEALYLKIPVNNWRLTMVQTWDSLANVAKYLKHFRFAEARL